MRFKRLRRWAHKATGNALEIARLGRLGADQHAVYEVKDKTPHYRLRHYLPLEPPAQHSAPLLLVPPLMLTAEIYDVSPDLSAVSLLRRRGIDVWVVDFGAPEREQGGMDRTLDDHLRAVVRAAQRVKALSGAPVHLAGYSQGGMFAYQAAAYLRGEGLASVITFGSPVDIHKTVPAVYSDITRRLIQGVRPLVELPLRHIDGLPAKLTSTGFKVLTPRKELQQLVRFVSQLHDRQAIQKQQTRRRFLGGGGFVAWPGPALEQFFDQFIVHNRMLAGGIVLDGRTLTLADIDCPILYFVGHRDDVARPATVRAIRKAAPRAETYERGVRAGHFGLVVGSSSLAHTWPAVADWIQWRTGQGPRPAELRGGGMQSDHVAPQAESSGHHEPLATSYGTSDDDSAQSLPWQWLQDELMGAARERWKRLGHTMRDAGDAVHDLRWQLPRLTQLVSMSGDSRISASLVLSRQARSIGDKPFFLFQGRAFSYAQANERVNHVVRGLVACGLRGGDKVAVVMGGRPSLLSLVTALSRLGAVAVLVDTRLQGDELRRALQLESCRAVIGDPEHAEALRATFEGEVLILGGGARRKLGPEVVDMEAIDTTAVSLPPDFEPDPGRARDPAMVFIRGVHAGALKVSRISHGRWAFSAIGVASSATLSPADTVYCGWGLPLSHPTSMMVAMGGALVGGARLSLPHGEDFSAAEFWQQVRRYGATVAFYAGELPRKLLTATPAIDDRDHPLRLLAGSGMRADLWRDLQERFGIGVMEFYASTERNLVLANASGEKPGALGQPLPGSSELALARYDFERDRFATRSETGGDYWLRCRADEPGVALVRANANAAAPHAHRNVFAVGDAWFVSSDVLRRDKDGDYWFVDRLRNMVRSRDGLLATPPIEDALYRIEGVALAVAYGEAALVAGKTTDTSQLTISSDTTPLPGTMRSAMTLASSTDALEQGHEIPVAAVVSDSPLDAARVTEVLSELPPAQRPRKVRRVATLPMTDSQRPLKHLLRSAPPDEPLQELVYDAAAEGYRAIGSG